MKTHFFFVSDLSRKQNHASRGNKTVPLAERKKVKAFFFRFQEARLCLSRKQNCASRGIKSVPLTKVKPCLSQKGDEIKRVFYAICFSNFFSQKLRKTAQNRKAEKIQKKPSKKEHPKSRESAQSATLSPPQVSLGRLRMSAAQLIAVKKPKRKM
jgi:hypothetical protein